MLKVIFCGLVVAGALAAGSGTAAAASLAGEWVGGGVVEPSSGRSERVRCRVRYSQVTPNVFAVHARCASASGALNQSGRLTRVRSNRYVGDFYNSQFRTSGRARVIVNGSQQSISLFGDAGRGRLTLRKR